MFYDLTTDDIENRQRVPWFVHVLDWYFILILYMGNFTHAFIDKETGSGRYVPMMILAFGFLSVPFWRYYYSKWIDAIYLFAAFFALGAFSDILYLGSYDMVTFILQRQLFMNVFYLLVAYNIMWRDSRYIKWIIYAVVFSAVINALLLLFGVSVVESFERGVEGARSSLLGQNANATSRVFAVALSFVSLIALRLIKLNKIVTLILLVSAPLMFVGMLKVGSRGGLLALALTVPAVLMTARSLEKKMIVFIILAILVIVAIPVVLHNDVIFSRLSNTFFDRDTGGREKIFYACIDVWKKAKWLGHGLIMYGRELAITTGHNNIGMESLASHCSYTFALCSSGIFGAILYFIFLWDMFYCTMKIRFFPFGNFCFVAYILSLFCAFTQNIEKSAWTALVYAATLAVYKKLKLKGFV